MLKIIKNNSLRLFSLFSAFFLILSACHTSQKIEKQKNDTVDVTQEETSSSFDFKKFANKVAIVEKTSSHIVYEYQDIRVDEIALLAALYCQEHGDRNAHLDKINLHKNNKRRATFYCSRH